MLTLTFIILVYSVLLNNSDLNIIKATAQRWMLNGTGGIRYQIVFATKAFVKNIIVEEVWINNRHYKVNSPSATTASVHFDNAETEKILSIDLHEEMARKNSDPVAEQMKKFIPGNTMGSGDVIIVYHTKGKKKYHVIPLVENLPFAIAS